MISVVIPCHISHLKYIKELLNIYQKQTLLPSEIIIVISEYDNKYDEIIKNIEDHNYKFEIKIIKICEKSFAGNNRYIGTNNSKGDIIIFQDADDIPHPQRVEIINYYFNKYSDIVHIVHKFTYDTHDSTFINYDINNIDHSYIKTNALFLLIKVRKMTSITNGNIAIRKNIYEKLNWYNDIRRGQDVKFNSDIYTKYKKSLYIKIPLLNYKYLLSTK